MINRRTVYLFIYLIYDLLWSLAIVTVEMVTTSTKTLYLVFLDFSSAEAIDSI